MKKPQPKKKRTPRPPAGLVAVFSVLTCGDYKPEMATRVARATYPHAAKVVKTLLADRDELIVVEEIEAAVSSLFPNLEDAPTVTTAQEAAFDVGFAVCWLLMTSINGQGTAR